MFAVVYSGYTFYRSFIQDSAGPVVLLCSVKVVNRDSFTLGYVVVYI